MDAIKKAVDLLGGAPTTATKLGVSYQLVYFWLRGERKFPVEKCPVVERLTDGAVRCEDLRPDVEWSVVRQANPAGVS
jgi:DNA-binding transcriptional regulator YdaS (Cro superfamily)